MYENITVESFNRDGERIESGEQLPDNPRLIELLTQIGNRIYYQNDCIFI